MIDFYLFYQMNAVVYPVLILFCQVTQRTTGSDMGLKFQRALLIVNFCSRFSNFPACFHRLINARIIPPSTQQPRHRDSWESPQDGSEASWETSTRIELKTEFPGAAVRGPVPAPASCSPSQAVHKPCS